MANATRASERDVTGQRFGMLVALGKSSNRPERVTAYLWRFRCDCGKEIERIKNNVIRGGAVQSCGCLPDLQVSKNPDLPKLDIAGMRFGALVAVGPIAKTGQGWNWAFLCDCGMATIARRKDVTNGNTASCGCLRGRKEVAQIKRPWSPDRNAFSWDTDKTALERWEN